MYINMYINIHADLCTHTNINTTRARQYYLLSAGPAAKAGAAAAAAAAGVRDVPAIAPVYVDTHSHQYEQEAARQQTPSVSVYKHNMLNVWMINTHTHTNKNVYIRSAIQQHSVHGGRMCQTELPRTHAAFVTACANMCLAVHMQMHGYQTPKLTLQFRDSFCRNTRAGLF